jgi:hypothetical protein
MRLTNRAEDFFIQQPAKKQEDEFNENEPFL